MCSAPMSKRSTCRPDDAQHRRSRPPDGARRAHLDGAHRGLPRPHRGRRSQDRELRHPHRRSRTPRGQAGRQGDEPGAQSRPAARHPDRAEGHLRDRRRADDRPFASARRLCARDRRRDRAPPESGRRGHPGQARHPRIRQRRDDARPAVPGGAQSLEHRLPARRLVERLGRGGCRRALHGRHGLRHRRLDPQSGGLLRHRRHQADLRPGQPLRHLPPVVQLRHGGPARLDGRGQRADARRAGGLRSQRPGLGQGAQGRLRRRRRSVRSRACASRWRAPGTRAA